MKGIAMFITMLAFCMVSCLADNLRQASSSKQRSLSILKSSPRNYLRTSGGHSSKSDILEAAQDRIGACGGRLGCAVQVSAVLRSAGIQLNTASTRAMYEMLCRDDRFERTSLSSASPGAIVISPSTRRTHGHVGILDDSGRILSNSSRRRRFDDHFDKKSWLRYYSQCKGLQTVAFVFTG